LFIAIPVIVGIITLRRTPPENPSLLKDEPIPPPS
jgi:hypothetical protein